MADSLPTKKCLEWDPGMEAEIASRDELDAIVDRLHAEAESQPFTVELVAEDGAALSVGLGRPHTVVNYVPETLDPPYFQSMAGDGGDEELVFRYRGEWSEYPPESAVPVDVWPAGAPGVLRHGPPAGDSRVANGVTARVSGLPPLSWTPELWRALDAPPPR